MWALKVRHQNDDGAALAQMRMRSWEQSSAVFLPAVNSAGLMGRKHLGIETEAPSIK